MKHFRPLIWFDLIRGLSAVEVCAFHLRGALLTDFHHSPVARILNFGTLWGEQAVAVFFVLSGFFVGGSILKKGDGFSWRQYAAARLSRLYIVLVPALILTLCVDTIGKGIHPSAFSAEWKGGWHHGPQYYSADLPAFLANSVFLQDIVAPPYGSNVPLWSLACEFWYYLAFPLLVMGIKGRGFGQKSVGILLALVILYLLPFYMSWRFVIWLMGVAVWLGYEKSHSFNHRLLQFGAGLVALVAALAFCLSPDFTLFGRYHIPFELNEIFVGVAFSFLALCIARAAKHPRGGRKQIAVEGIRSVAASIATGLSEMSYSLYLTHAPVVMLISIAIYGFHGNLPSSVYGAFVFGLWMLLLLAVGFLFWWLFERRTAEVRRWLYALLLPSVGRMSPDARGVAAVLSSQNTAVIREE